jgi:hypothetical protein
MVLRGTEGSNPSPSSAESGANLTSGAGGWRSSILRSTPPIPGPRWMVNVHARGPCASRASLSVSLARPSAQFRAAMVAAVRAPKRGGMKSRSRNGQQVANRHVPPDWTPPAPLRARSQGTGNQRWRCRPGRPPQQERYPRWIAIAFANQIFASTETCAPETQVRTRLAAGG